VGFARNIAEDMEIPEGNNFMSDELIFHRRPTIAQKKVAGGISFIRYFMDKEAMGGIFLLLAAVLALILANSSAYNLYEEFTHLPFSLGWGAYSFKFDMHFLVNEVLMTVFFLMVGVEIRQEMYDGALSKIKQAALPLVAACGGVCAPAIIYTYLNLHTGYLHGWGVPTATDIAFAVGILALLGKAVPANLRIILLSLAVIDDIIAVLIIAFFYSNGLSPAGACIAVAAIIFILILRRLGIRHLLFYALGGIVLWYGLRVTGVHPSLSGVILGLLTPVLPLYDANGLKDKLCSVLKPLNALAEPAKADSTAAENAKLGEAAKALVSLNRLSKIAAAPTKRVERALHFWVAFGVMPLFAFTNAGVRVEGIDFGASHAMPVALGVMCGLIFGKPIGVMLASFIFVKCGICRLPPNVTWPGMVLVGLLAGIGFTMAVFVSMLSFHHNPEVTALATLGILCGSGISAVLGLTYGALYLRAIRKKV